MSRVDINTVLDRLHGEQLLTDRRMADTILAEMALVQPWYVRSMVGFGAWVASLMLIGFVAGLGLVECAVTIDELWPRPHHLGEKAVGGEGRGREGHSSAPTCTPPHRSRSCGRIVSIPLPPDHPSDPTLLRDPLGAHSVAQST